MHVCQNNQTWTNVTFNMTPYAGQTVRIKFLVHGDNAGDPTYMYVDDVQLTGGVCASPTGTPATATRTPTITVTPTPGCGGPLIGSGLTIGYAPNNFTTLASNITNYAWANGSPSA